MDESGSFRETCNTAELTAIGSARLQADARRTRDAVKAKMANVCPTHEPRLCQMSRVSVRCLVNEVVC